MSNSPEPSEKIILALVGMPGAGKSEATQYLDQKGMPFIRFGTFTEEALKKAGMDISTKNEKFMREKLREDMGMEAYAILIKPKIDELLKNNNYIVLDGLYSWEEYIYLKKFFPFLKIILIYAEPSLRYERLTKRSVRPVAMEDTYSRDVNEIEKLNKGGPIAIADYLIENNDENISALHDKIDNLLSRLGINL